MGDEKSKEPSEGLYVSLVRVLSTLNYLSQTESNGGKKRAYKKVGRLMLNIAEYGEFKKTKERGETDSETDGADAQEIAE